MIVIKARRRRAYRSNSVFNHFLQNRKTLQPLGRLQHDQKSWPDVSLVKNATPVDGRLAGEGTDRLQTSLNRHQTKLFTKVVRIDRFQSATATRVEQEQTVGANFSKG